MPESDWFARLVEEGEELAKKLRPLIEEHVEDLTEGMRTITFGVASPVLGTVTIPWPDLVPVSSRADAKASSWLVPLAAKISALVYIIARQARRARDWREVARLILDENEADDVSLRGAVALAVANYILLGDGKGMRPAACLMTAPETVVRECARIYVDTMLPLIMSPSGRRRLAELVAGVIINTRGQYLSAMREACARGDAEPYRLLGSLTAGVGIEVMLCDRGIEGTTADRWLAAVSRSLDLWTGRIDHVETDLAAVRTRNLAVAAAIAIAERGLGPLDEDARKE